MKRNLDLTGNVSIEQLLNHIMDLGGSLLNHNPHIIIPRSVLTQASTFTRNTINNCISSGLIVEVPYAKTASEYNLTAKGLEFISPKRKVNGQSV